jgi:hypothetical protein
VSLQLDSNLNSGHRYCTEIPTEENIFIIVALNSIIEFNNEQIKKLIAEFDNL